MIKYILLAFAISSTGLSLSSLQSYYDQMLANAPDPVLEAISVMLHEEATDLSPAVIDKTLAALRCAEEKNIESNNIISIIDYSLPSNVKRLWIFDLQAKKLLFHTYVSHGIRSGYLASTYFSNKNNSKASSIGLYRTEQSYYGREGLSLRLEGLDRRFNDNAMNRALVMHAGWYVNEPFIQKYGRAGRSWGCPTVPLDLASSIINTIKNHSLLLIYYPNDDWFAQSRYLNCKGDAAQSHTQIKEMAQPEETEPHDPIVFADINNNHKYDEYEPVVVVTTDDYSRIFHRDPPLTRMLRRQINNVEYIVISEEEFQQLGDNAVSAQHGYSFLDFVTPMIVDRRGYHATEMKLMPWGHVENIQIKQVFFEKKSSITIEFTDQFIRWLGL